MTKSLFAFTLVACIGLGFAVGTYLTEPPEKVMAEYKGDYAVTVVKKSPPRELTRAEDILIDLWLKYDEEMAAKQQALK